jgi:hypothetical protein
LILLPIPVKACAPTLQNWWTSVKPPRITWSSTVTCPASVAALAKMIVVADDAVVRDVHVGHDPVVVADAGDAAAVRGAAVEGDELADRVAVADDQFGRLAVELLVLRIATEGGARIDVILAPIRVGPSITTCEPMRVPSPISTSGADDAERADADVLADACARVDLGVGWIMSASAPRTGSRRSPLPCRRSAPALVQPHAA